MNTYVIDVEKKIISQYIVEAGSLEEAKQIAVEKDGADGPKESVSVLCRRFYPCSGKK